MNILNIITTAILMSVSGNAFALPILNSNTPLTNPVPLMLTIYGDHLDKNLYYLVPKALGIAHDDHGIPLFSYNEVIHRFSIGAVIQVAMVPIFDEAAIAQAKQSILTQNPKATFAFVPFAHSEIIFPNMLSEFVESSDCNHDAGVIGSQETCLFKLTPQGRIVLVNAMRHRAAIFMNLKYTVDGVEEEQAGIYKPKTLSWEISGDIGGTELASCPQLFIDSYGYPINFRDGNFHNSAGCGKLPSETPAQFILN